MPAIFLFIFVVSLMMLVINIGQEMGYSQILTCAIKRQHYQRGSLHMQTYLGRNSIKLSVARYAAYKRGSSSIYEFKHLDLKDRWKSTKWCICTLVFGFLPFQ